MKKTSLIFASAFLASAFVFAAPKKNSSFPKDFDPLVNTKKETTNYVNFKKDKNTGEIFTEYLCDKVMTEEEIAKTMEATPKVPRIKKTRNFLVWDRTEGFRHTEGIPALRTFLECLEKKSNGKLAMHFTDDRREFESLENLKKYDCVIINNCTGRFFESYRGVREGYKGDQYREKTEGMTGDEKREDEKMNYVCRDNLIRYVSEGGGIMGAHAACDAMDCRDNKHKFEEKSPELIEILKKAGSWDDVKNEEKFSAYPVMMGGRFAGHPWGAGNKEETFIIEDPKHPVVKGIWAEDSFKLQDEIYTFIEAYGYDRNKQRILISIDYDKSPLNDGADPMTRTNRKNKDFGLVWVKEFGKGRIFYGAFGHRKDVYYRNPEVCEMYMRGLLFASGETKLKKNDLKPLGEKKNPYYGK